MEINLSPSGSISDKTTNLQCMLLRRPKPPKPILTRFPSSKSTDHAPPRAGSTDTSSNGPIKNVVTFSDQPSGPKNSSTFTNRRHKSLPIEDLYRTDIEQLVQQQSMFVVNPVFPRGPEPFPPGRVMRADTLTTTTAMDFLPDEIHLAKIGPSFTLNDLQLPPAPHPPPIQISQGAVSRQNYLKLTSWFATHVPSQESVNKLELEVDHQAPASRVPKRQLLAELQAMINTILKDSLSGSIQTSTSSLNPQWPPPAPEDALFRSATSRYFCGQARSASPFDADHQPFISPSEVAILESMMSGGSHLSLKAHFIDRLPLLTPLLHTLTSLNLSYNSFKGFPSEILQLQSLVFLAMRNNPLKEIPNEIGCLQNLHFLTLSFCNLSQLPPGLFDLPNLVDLDISYNNLYSIPRDFCKLTNLCKLNIEGNRLPGLPATALSVPVSHIILGNNLMHPLLWKDNTKNDPQTLVDICCTVIRKSVEDLNSSQLSPEILEIIHRQSRESCDECLDDIFGQGLQVVRSVEHGHYKIKNLPFIFTVCSPTCSSLLRNKPAKFWLKN